jgi:hypothetical protein
MLPKRQRAIVILGAGASVEYGIPATIPHTDIIENAVCADAWMKRVGGDVAFRKIKNDLSGYLTNPGVVHFEQIYHCVHELLHFFPPTSGAADEFKPLLQPFLTNNAGIDKDALGPLERKIIEVIFSEVSSLCNTPKCSLYPLAEFLKRLGERHTTRIYSTNYDDFPLQAAEGFFTGFEKPTGSCARFNGEQFWDHSNEHALFQLHGSVHMAYGEPGRTDIGELCWYEDRAEALQHFRFSGSGERRMDGTLVVRSPIITGLDKLSRIQQRPFCYYYAALARDLMDADVIYVIGSGLADLHMNTWLHEARSKNRRTPLVFVDYWANCFAAERFEPDSKLIALFHSMNVHTNELREHDYGAMDGWTISQDSSAAVWDQGFQKFLGAPDALEKTLQRIDGM